MRFHIRLKRTVCDRYCTEIKRDHRQIVMYTEHCVTWNNCICRRYSRLSVIFFLSVIRLIKEDIWYITCVGNSLSRTTLSLLHRHQSMVFTLRKSVQNMLFGKHLVRWWLNF